MKKLILVSIFSCLLIVLGCKLHKTNSVTSQEKTPVSKTAVLRTSENAENMEKEMKNAGAEISKTENEIKDSIKTNLDE